MKLIHLFFLLILVPSVYAASTSIERTLGIGESILDDTRNLTLISVTETRVVVEVDSQFKDTISIGESKEIEGVNVTLNETFYVLDPTERKATLLMEVLWKNECTIDSDCDDGDACTINYCTGSPRSCDYDDSEYDVTVCIADGCCADSCSYRNDPDCDQPCSKDSQCDDDDPSTVDECTGEKGNPGVCIFSENTECSNGDDYCPVGCVYGTDHADTSDADCSQSNECSYDEECDDGDAGTKDSCSGYGTAESPRICSQVSVTECKFNDDFCPLGCTEINDNDCASESSCGDSICDANEDCSTCVTDCGCISSLVCSGGECIEPVRVCENLGERSTLDFGGEFYCSEYGWKSIKSGGTRCEAEYECKSDVCEEGKCVSVEFVKEARQRQLATVALIIVGTGTLAYLMFLLLLSKKSDDLV